jgi:2-polyprenyl-3-methyl-5-hydroxy-6-metoxy-1,4-benzoquinol methylase
MADDISPEVAALIVEAKGAENLEKYEQHKALRSRYLVPLFERLNANRSGLRILEIGCSAGHITEWLSEQPSVGDIHTFDVDARLVKAARLRLSDRKKVTRCEHLQNEQTINLPFEDDAYDVVIALAVVEHLPQVQRYQYVDQYYRKAREGGLVCFFETPNRWYFWESHSFQGLFYHWLPNGLAYVVARLWSRRVRTASPARFVRPGIGWRGPSYFDLVPRAVGISVDDISEEMGYGYPFFVTFYDYGVLTPIIRAIAHVHRPISKLLGVPTSWFLPVFDAVFRKGGSHDEE